MKKNKKPGVGFGVMILRKGKVLLGKRHSDPQKADSALHGEGTWTMPGGKLLYKEKLEDAAYREVYEETGIKINEKKLKLISVTNDIVFDNHFVTIGFLYKSLKGNPEVREPDEIVKWQWFNLKKLPKPIFSCSKKIFKNYRKNQKINLIAF